MWAIFNKTGKILKTFEMDEYNARLGSTEFSIFAIFLLDKNEDIQHYQATITFEKPDYNHTKYPPLPMYLVQRKFVPSSQSEDKTDYAPLIPNQSYWGFEFNFNEHVDDLVLLDANGLWKYSIDLVKDDLSTKFIAIHAKNATIDDKTDIFDKVKVGESKTYKIVAKTGYKPPAEIDINLPTTKYEYDYLTGILTIKNVETDVIVSLEGAARKKVEIECGEHIHILGVAENPYTDFFYQGYLYEIKFCTDTGYELPDTITITGTADYDYTITPQELRKNLAKLSFKSFEDVSVNITGATEEADFLLFNSLSSTSADPISLIMHNMGSNDPDVEYTLNGSDWIKLEKGKSIGPARSIGIRGKNPKGFSQSTSDYTYFKTDKPATIVGNINSLIGESATIPNEYCFYGLFINAEIKDIDLELPFADLTKGCYEKMFYGCTMLNIPPKMLAITNLAENSCKQMFEGCIDLNVRDDVGNKFFTCPTTIPTDAVTDMFKGTKSPELAVVSAGKTYYYEG